MLLAFILFFVGYFISMTYTSIFYHRALCHKGLELSPFMVKFVEKTGMWVTGIDPLSWVCMHRLHHAHSDTEKDPHSPVHTGFWYTFIRAHKSFSRIATMLILKRKQYTDLVQDIPFGVHTLNAKGLWWLPFFVHFVIAIVIGFFTSNYLASAGYMLGIAGHPIQGFLVNAFGHAVGYRNFGCNDNSKNNTLVAWFVFGEGYQNNHHQFPSSPKFSMRIFEFDPGYIVVKVFSWLGIVKILKQKIPDGQMVHQSMKLKSAHS